MTLPKGILKTKLQREGRVVKGGAIDKKKIIQVRNKICFFSEREEGDHTRDANKRRK